MGRTFSRMGRPATHQAARPVGLALGARGFGVFVLVLAVGAGLLGADKARAQSPVSEVKDSGGTTLMTVFDNGELKVTGGFRLPDGTLLDESSDLGDSLSLPFSGSASASDPLLELIQNGSGEAGFFDIANSSSSEDVLTATTVGTGRAGEFKIFNDNSGASALFAQTGGSGSAVRGLQTGTNGRAGRFAIDNADSFIEALLASTNGSGNAIKGLNSGTGRAGLFQVLNESSNANALAVTTNGTGRAGNFRVTNVDNGSPALFAETVGIGRAGLFRIANSASGAEALRVETNGGSHAGAFEIDNASNDSSAVSAITNGTGPAVQGVQRGSEGYAGHFEVKNSTHGETALRAETNGTGPAVKGIQSGSAPDSSAHAGFFEIFNTNSDAEALLARTNGSGEAIDAIQTGTGPTARAGLFRITSSNNDNAALRASTFGSGFAAKLVASKSATVRDNPAGNVALIKNNSGQSGPDVLGLQAGPSNPALGVNYVSFYDRSGISVGAIEGNGSGGVRYKTSGADYAEALPVTEDLAEPEPADLVGVRGGEVSLNTSGADRLMVVTGQAAVLGNAARSGATKADRVPVAFVGQVPVKLRGEARPGDLIVASGRADGTARAVSPGAYRRAEHGPIAGQAWAAKATSGVGTVTVAVGLDQSGALTERLRQQRQRNARQEERIAELEAENEQIKNRLATLEAQSTGTSMLAGLPESGLLFVLLTGGLLIGGLLMGGLSVGTLLLGRRRK